VLFPVEGKTAHHGSAFEVPKLKFPRMKRCWSFVLLTTRLLSGGAGQISAFRGYQKTLQLPVAGATAVTRSISNMR